MRSAAAAAFLAIALLNAATAGDDSPKGEDVRFMTADGVSIAATWYAPADGTPLPAPAIVALPMYRHTRSSYAPMVRPVTERGMGFLAVDLRGHGDSVKQGDADLSKRVESRDATLFNAMHQDVEAAIAWLAKEKKTPRGKIGLLGASVGCSVAIDTAVRHPDDVAAVVCLTPGAAYLGVPTMEHVEKWPKGKPLLLASSEDEAKGGAGPIAAKLEGRGAELRIVQEAAKPDEAKGIHGTDMFGRVPDVETNVADWLAREIAFHRIDVGEGVTALVGSTGGSLYVGVVLPPDSKTRLDGLVVRVGLGPVTDPWSKSVTLDAGRHLGDRHLGDSSAESDAAPGRRRTKIDRDRVGAEAGRPFAVAVSLDGKTFHPETGEPPLLVTLR